MNNNKTKQHSILNRVINTILALSMSIFVVSCLKYRIGFTTYSDKKNDAITFSTNSISDDSFTVTIKSQISGTLYWAIYSDDSTDPDSILDLKMATPKKNGVINASSVKIDGITTRFVTVSASNLEPDTEYEIYAAVVYNNNIFTKIYEEEITTTDGTIKIANVTVINDSISLKLSLSKTGLLYWALYEENHTKPNTLAIINAFSDTIERNGNLNISSTGIKTIDINNLNTGTRYTFYAVLVENPNGDNPSTIVSISIKTHYKYECTNGVAEDGYSGTNPNIEKCRSCEDDYKRVDSGRCILKDADNDGIADSVDIDEDGDGLIEIHNIEILNNIRNVLNGSGYNNGSNTITIGCGGQTDITICSGYELNRNLNFSDSSSYASGVVDTSYTTDPGWDPIGFYTSLSDNDPFDTTFEGNGYAISNLYIRNTRQSVGLFGQTGSTANIRNIGIVDVNITAGINTGGLVGENFGTISNSYSTGTVSGSSTVGGLVGSLSDIIENVRNRGTISNSYSTSAVSGGDFIGGLVGRNDGGIISKSYAMGNVLASNSGPNQGNLGGLVGEIRNTGMVFNSYSTGAVSGSNHNIGGLVGSTNSTTSANITNNYWDTNTSNQDNSAAGTGLNTSAMQSTDNSATIRRLGGNFLFFMPNGYPLVCKTGTSTCNIENLVPGQY